ncbi:MAG: hypothetical protein ABI968_04430 [Acidobacteriota bacterium]
MRTTLRSTLALALLLGLSLPAFAVDSKDTEASPQAKVYRASQKAIAAGDADAYAKTMTAEANKQMVAQAKEMGKTPKDLMELMKIMSPADVKLSDLKVNGKKATMTGIGSMDKEQMKGTIELEEEGGQWKIRTQSWTNTK